MTVYRLKNNPETGDLAIYTVPEHSSTDDTPLDDPYADPSRLQFHSGMLCPSTTPELTQTTTITIPAQSSNSKYSGQINLFPHGKGEPCMVEGSFTDPDTGNEVAFNGTMPVNVTDTGHATWIALGATDTHVVLVYFGITYLAFSAFDLDITASAYDFLASGQAETSDPSLPLLRHVKNQFLQIGRGKIDTRRRYLRRVEVDGDFALATGPTLSIIGDGNTNAHPSGGAGSYVQLEVGWRWRYSCDGYVKQTTKAWNGSATDGGTYNAPFIRVKR
jgi:hypothetical protein